MAKKVEVSSSMKNSPMVYLYGYTNVARVWYRIDIESLCLHSRVDTNKPKTECRTCYAMTIRPDPEPIQLSPFAQMTSAGEGSWTIVGEDIYFVGGFMVSKGSYPRTEEYSSNLRKLNTKNPTSGWKITSSSMNFGWVRPFVASIGRKLYVLGGPNEREKSPDREFYWGEIYDLDSKVWKVLELDISTFPDFIDSNCHVVEKDGEGTRIILFLFRTNSLLFYNVNTNEFLIEDHPSLYLSRPDPQRPEAWGGIWELRSNRPVLNNSTLYWFTYDLYLYGYDLVEKRWFLSKCLKKELWTIPPKTWWDDSEDPRKPILVDLYNGKFLLIVTKGADKLAVAILTVVKDKDSLNVSVESLHTLLVDPSFDLCNAMVMQV